MNNYGRDQITHSGPGSINVNNTLGQESGLQKLATKAAFSALFDSKARDAQTGCLEGTREGVIEELSLWAESADSERLCWLYGGAGVGKSAVAQSICEKYTDSRLAASFFYSRNDSSRNSFEPFIPTIAHQLATSPAYKKAGFTSALEDNIRSKPGIFDMSWNNQFKWLIQEPLERIEPAQRDRLPILIVIDGLDECMAVDRSTSGVAEPSASASDAIKAQETLLSVIRNAVWTHPSLPLHFLIVSRPEHAIRAFFCSTPSKPSPVHRPVDMRNYRTEADRDIQLFLEKEFAALPDSHREAMIEAGWPGEDIIQELIRKSDGHFIYVVTLMKYISQRDDPEFKLPQERLDIILQMDETSYPDLSDLDRLFQHILRRFTDVRERILLPILQLLVTPHNKIVSRSLHERFFDIPWRSQHAISRILDLDSRQVAMVLSRLHSIIQVPDCEHREVSFLHASFSDFLQEKRRSHNFYVPPINGSSYLDLLSRRLLPILMDFTNSYQAGDKRVQPVNQTGKFESRSITVWPFVKEALSSQDYVHSDGLLSDLNGFDMFQYMNMLLDWKYMLTELAHEVEGLSIGMDPENYITWLLDINIHAIFHIYRDHFNLDRSLRDKLRPFLARLKSFFEGSWVTIFPNAPERYQCLAQLTQLVQLEGTIDDRAIAFSAHDWKYRRTFLKIFPDGVNSRHHPDLENRCIARQQRAAFAKALERVASHKRGSLPWKDIKEAITTTLLHESSISDGLVCELIRLECPSTSCPEEGTVLRESSTLDGRVGELIGREYPSSSSSEEGQLMIIQSAHKLLVMVRHLLWCE